MDKISKNQLKYYSSLLQKKYRRAEGKFIAEGRKLISEALGSSYFCEALIVTGKFSGQNKDMIELIPGLKDAQIFTASEKEFSKLTDTKSPQGIAGVFKSDRKMEVHHNRKIIIALENISDPGNIGTIFRNCDWFGVTDILLSPDCTEVFNPKVLRASMGSVFHLNISTPDDFYGELHKLRDEGYVILNTNLSGENIYQYKMPDKLVMVFSNEANGPTEYITKFADVNITIPKFGNAESLNVASSSAIVLSEIFAINQTVSHN